MFEREE
jgi:hypothetical protein